MILHLSDLHFGTEQQDCLNAIQQFCLQHSPEVVVVSGDLTQRARFQQFYACKQFLDSLQLPYLVVPGNHDIPLYQLWQRLRTPFLRYQLFFGKMENTLETEHFYLIGINSIRRRHHTRGAVSLEQIQRVSHALQQAPVHKHKIVVAHQPFYASALHSHGLKDCPLLGKMALDVWSRYGLHALLHGHLHQAAVFDLNQIYRLGAKQPVLDIHAGTATSYRLHHGLPNSFNLIDRDLNVTVYDFDAQRKSFILRETLPIQ